MQKRETAQGVPMGMLAITMRLAVTASLLYAAPALGGCRPEYAQVKADGIHYPRYSYVVRYSNPERRLVLDRQWILDNFHRDHGGNWVLNTGERYRAKAKIDRDGDGRYETESVHLFDLKLDYRASNAVIWIQTQELSVKSEEKSLETLLENYAESLTGAGFYAEANVFSVQVEKQRRYVAIVRDKKWTRVGRKRALEARIQVLDLDKRKVDPNHSGHTIQVTLLKIPYHYEIGQDPVKLHIGHCVMLIGYVNTTKVFGNSLPQYYSLRKLIRFEPMTD